MYYSGICPRDSEKARIISVKIVDSPRRLENDTSRIKIKVIVFINNCIILATYDLAFPTNLLTIRPLRWEICLFSHFDTRSLLWHLRAILYLPTHITHNANNSYAKKEGTSKANEEMKRNGEKTKEINLLHW